MNVGPDRAIRRPDAVGVDVVIADSAWGREPGRWPLPTAFGALDRWHRAVALGGQGRYSSAVAELDTLAAWPGLPSGLRSLSASTRASWLRQVGRHGIAARYDGLAVVLVGCSESSDRQMIEAQCDALTGLAADMLGVGRLSASEALLSRCESILARTDPTAELWRQQLRAKWVRAELAMISGDGSSALRHATGAYEHAADIVSLRHRVKTELVLAAAYCSAGDVPRARVFAFEVLEACVGPGLVPLRWAAAMLLNGIGEVTTAQPIVTECAAILSRRGAVLAVA